MSFYDNDASWGAIGRQQSWEQPPPPSRSGTGSSMSQQPDPTAFASQFEEIERATDNLVKSGKWFPGPMQQNPMMGMSSHRRESIPGVGRNYEYGDPRMGHGPSRHPSVSEFETGRPGSSGLQGYYQGQRFPQNRQSEAEQVMQQKRRMAAQRERELRNYHQEQQYNRNVSGAKSDRSMSPNTMSEEDRRELIARQHRALYGDNASLYTPDGSAPRPQSQDVRVSNPGRGNSPLAYDSYGTHMQPGSDSGVQMPPRDRGNNTASPASGQTPQQPFPMFSDAQQSSRTSTSSPGTSPPPGQTTKGGIPGVAPIGTRPVQASNSAGGMNKRSTTPLTPSSLSYGYGADVQNVNSTAAERSTSASSNPPIADKNVSNLGGWGSNSGVWGGGKNLAVQPSVWG